MSESIAAAAVIIASQSGAPVTNNIMRHEYRALSDEDKAKMQKIKDMGAEFHAYIHSLGQDRETSLAKTKIEEAVMWAVKHVTR